MVEPTAETLATFVQFVRMNPSLPPDSPTIAKAFYAYLDLQDRDYHDPANLPSGLAFGFGQGTQIDGGGVGSQDPSDEAQQRPLRGSMPSPATAHRDGDEHGS